MADLRKLSAKIGRPLAWVLSSTLLFIGLWLLVGDLWLAVSAFASDRTVESLAVVLFGWFFAFLGLGIFGPALLAGLTVYLAVIGALRMQFERWRRVAIVLAPLTVSAALVEVWTDDNFDEQWSLNAGMLVGASIFGWRVRDPRSQA